MHQNQILGGFVLSVAGFMSQIYKKMSEENIASDMIFCYNIRKFIKYGVTE